MSDESQIPDPDRANRWHAYMHGWKDGAVNREARIKAHPDKGIVDAYNSGYDDGRRACEEAAAAATQRTGYSPRILR